MLPGFARSRAYFLGLHDLEHASWVCMIWGMFFGFARSRACFLGLHDLGHVSCRVWVGNLYADPAQPLTAAGKELDHLSVYGLCDISVDDLSVQHPSVGGVDHFVKAGPRSTHPLKHKISTNMAVIWLAVTSRRLINKSATN